ncbi:hypothetical protein Q5P01_003153 [Channa striata]|uniref:Ig-like domain-containing protein n=1 Tax=Channa striata TaxID=64152 RepID=A0AA88NQN5_CHASR|nr:hypothetical protein Q5P01_003153 [Channa striata]
MRFVEVVILLFVCQHASGVEVYEGEESVLLPCRVNVSVSQRSTVAWSREELKNPDVHVRQPSGDDHTDQNPRYTDRTSMRTAALQTGDLSLTLSKPTISDSDTYTCTVRRMGKLLSQTEVQLLVREPPPPVWPWVLVLIILLLLAAICVCVYVAYKRMKKRRADFQVGMVEVTEGVESVLLPFTPTVNLSGNIRVKWIRSGSEPVTVHVYQNSHSSPHQQDEVYRGRTEMKDDLWKEDLRRGGDLSLTLRKPGFGDRGIYVCTIYKNGKFLTQKKVALCVKAFQVATIEVTEGVESVLLPYRITAGNGEILRQKRVALCVKACQVEKVEVTEGVDTVLLPFQTRGQLHEDVTVEWRCSDPKPMVVHVYPNNQTQPDIQEEVYRGRTEMKEDPMRTGDLSLTLRKPQFDDGGVYICTVSRVGQTLTQKIIVLCIQEDWKRTMECLYQDDRKTNDTTQHFLNSLELYINQRTSEAAPLMAD